MTLTARGGHSKYEPTLADVLWLQRAVAAEGKPRVKVAQTLVNQFMFNRHTAGSKLSLADSVRNYAQPVNPKWFVGGPRFEQKLALTASEAERTQLRAQAYTREHVHSKRTQFAPDVVLAVKVALNSPPDLPRATDFHAPYTRNELGELVAYTKSPGWVPLTRLTEGENRFWMRPEAIGWAGYLAGPVLGRPGVILVFTLVVGSLLWQQHKAAKRLRGKAASQLSIHHLKE